MLPGMSGMELCRRLRREPATGRTPVIMLTAKAAETDKIAGLEIGADDYIVKPFSVKEVIARVRAVLRRVEKEDVSKYADGKLSVDFADMRVICGDQHVKTDPQGIRPDRAPDQKYRPRLHPPAASRRYLGLQLFWRHAHAGRSHPPAAAKIGRMRHLC